MQTDAAKPGQDQVPPQGRAFANPNSVVWFAVTLAMITYLDRVAFAQAAPEIQQEFQLTKTQMGLLMAAFGWAYMLFEIPGGWLADRFGPRRLLMRIVCWWSFFTAATAWAWSFPSLLVTRFLFGAGEAGCFPGITRMFANWLHGPARVRAQSLTWAAARWGGAFTSVLVWWAVSAFGSWRRAFEVFGLIGVVWAVWFWRNFRDHPGSAGILAGKLEKATNSPAAMPTPTLHELPAGRARLPSSPISPYEVRAREDTRPAETLPEPRSSGRESAPSGFPEKLERTHVRCYGSEVQSANLRPANSLPEGVHPWRAWLARPAILLLCAQYGLLSVGFWFYTNWLPTYLREARGLEFQGTRAALLAGTPLFLGGLSCLLSGQFLAWLERRLGDADRARRLLAIAGFSGAAACLLAAMFARDATFALIAVGLAVFCNDLTMPGSWATCMDLGGAHAGALAGAMNMAGSAGGMLSPLLTGWLLDLTHNNWNVPLAVLATAYALGALCWLGIHRRPAQPREASA